MPHRQCHLLFKRTTQKKGQSPACDGCQNQAEIILGQVDPADKALGQSHHLHNGNLLQVFLNLGQEGKAHAEKGDANDGHNQQPHD